MLEFRIGVQIQEELNGGERQYRLIIYFVMRIINYGVRFNIRVSYILIGELLVFVRFRFGIVVGIEFVYVSELGVGNMVFD